MKFEIIQSDNGFAIILDGFSTRNESVKLISQINEALKIKKDYDNAVAESESIDQSYAKESDNFEEMQIAQEMIVQ